MAPFGPGLETGTKTDALFGFRPDDEAYVDHTGAVWTEQDEAGGGNVAYYEIQNTSDQIDIDVTRATRQFQDPTILFHTVFGPTDFSIEVTGSGSAFVSELSGFGTDVWFVNVTGRLDTLSITDFDTTNGVDGTQAAWYPYMAVSELQTDR